MVLVVKGKCKTGQNRTSWRAASATSASAVAGSRASSGPLPFGLLVVLDQKANRIQCQQHI